MELLINEILSASVETSITPDEKMFFLQAVIKGTYKKRETVHQSIVKIFQKNGFGTYDEMSLSDEGQSLIKILRCTTLKFIDLLRQQSFQIKEKEPELS